MKFTYLFIDLFSIGIPFLFSFHPAIKFYRHFKAFFAANLISALCFIIWDIIFTAEGIWGFNEKFTLGIKIYNLPLEEVLFFVCIPFACVFTYTVLSITSRRSWNGKREKQTTLFLAIIFFIVGMYCWDKAYTATTFISSSLLLFVVRFIFQQRLGSLYKAWLILLFPFFIVNGILTGTALASPVVWYNDRETLRIKILTIPVEDIVYGFELFLLTVVFYELFARVFNEDRKDAITLMIQHR